MAFKEGQAEAQATPASARTRDPRFGEAPLDQTVAAAGAMRRLTSLLLSLEHPHPTVAVMLTKFAEWEGELAAVAPADLAPRIGEVADAAEDPRRLYLSHATDIGDYNPCFPEYSFDHFDSESATGRVSFPVLYEGPPGLAHGGILALFFDSVIQHHSCVTGLSGKTRSLVVTFRRPTPILTELRFDIVREQAERGITATARVLLDGEVLCVGEAQTLASVPEKLSVFQFGRRRKEFGS